MVQAETAPPESDQVVIWNGQVIGSDPDAAVLMVMDAPLSESFIDLLDGCAEEREFFKLPIESFPAFVGTHPAATFVCDDACRWFVHITEANADNKDTIIATFLMLIRNRRIVDLVRFDQLMRHTGRFKSPRANACSN